jgi:hypothetical protein
MSGIARPFIGCTSLSGLARENVEIGKTQSVRRLKGKYLKGQYRRLSLHIARLRGEQNTRIRRWLLMQIKGNMDNEREREFCCNVVSRSRQDAVFQRTRNRQLLR